MFVVDVRTRVQHWVVDLFLPILHNQSQVTDENPIVERETGCFAVGIAVTLITTAARMRRPAIRLALGLVEPN